MKRLIVIISCLLLLLSSVAMQFALRFCNRDVNSPALAEGVIAALGGLRSVVAEVIWFRMDRLQEEGRYVELAQLAATLSHLEPHTPEVWSFAAWNLAYNISIMMPTHDDRWRWVKAAMELLRDDGLRLNPKSSELYRELAWMFEIKIGADIDSAAEIYRREWRGIVEDAASRGAWDELAMDVKMMDYVARVYGISDWTDPQASAIYWATVGLDRGATGNDRAFLLEIIRQARVIYGRSHG